MKKSFFTGLLFSVMVVFMSWGVCFAGIFSVLPEPAADNPCIRIAVKLTDASKLIEDLYPSDFIEAAVPLAAKFGLDDFIKISNVVKELSKSNLREFMFSVVLDDKFSPSDAGMIISVPNGKKLLDEAAASGKLTFFQLVSSLGEPVLDALRAADASIVNFEFERDDNGVFFHNNNYVYIEGDKIITFQTKERTLSTAEAVKSGIETGTGTEAAAFHPNTILAHTSKEIAKTHEDVKTEVGFSYEDFTWKIKIVSNVFKMLPGGDSVSLEGNELEDALKILEIVPMIGKGDPFLTSGGHTFIDGVDTIEERLMKTGDMDLALGWATFLQMTHQAGISKEDIGNLLSGSAVIVYGLDSKFLGIPLPIGGYSAITGKDGAAANIISAISESLAQTGVATESKIEGWDKVYSVTIGHVMPNALIAQKGETILIGIMDPAELKTELDIRKIGAPSDKMLSWMVFDTEKLWKALRDAYMPVSAMLLSGMFGNVPNEGREAIRFIGQLLRTDFPKRAVKLWMTSLDELDLHIIMNPSSGNFWKVLFEWANKQL